MAEKKEYFNNIADRIFKQYGVGERDLVFEIINPKYGDHKHIKGKARISHNGTIHNIRYAPAFDTPFTKEQKVDTGAKVEVKGINFDRLKVDAPKTDPCLQKFLLINPLCGVMGGKLFSVRDEDAKRAARLEVGRLKREAFGLLSDNYDIQKLTPVAVVLQPENTSIAKMEIGPIEEMITNYIETDPKKVIDAFNNDESELLYHFNKAVSLGIMTIDSLNGKVTWTDTGNKIFDIPHGVTPWRRWITFVNTGSGQVVYEAVKDQFE